MPVPPTVTPVELVMSIPKKLARAADPAALAPMMLPWMVTPAVATFWTVMPYWVLPEIRLPAPVAVPPTVTWLVAIEMPEAVLGRAEPPSALVPILLPWIRIDPARALMPLPALPEMTLPAARVVPPMVVPVEPVVTWTPAVLLGTAIAPVKSVPIWLPATRVFVELPMFTPAARVAGNVIAGIDDRAADSHVGGLVDQDTVAAVADGTGPGGVQANVVALDHIPLGAMEDVHAVRAVAGDDVAGAGDAAANRAGIVQVQKDALLAVADLGVAIAAQADVVVLDQGGAVAVDEDAGVVVARNDVACGGGRAADGGRGVGDPDAVGRVALRRGPGNADHADVVALDEGAGGRAHDGDAVPLVPGNDVAGRVRGAADGGAARVDDQHAGHVIAQGRDAVRGQADRVPRDQGAGGGAGDADADGHAACRRVVRGVIAGDQVAGNGGAGGLIDQDAVKCVAYGVQTVRAGADVVAQDHVALALAGPPAPKMSTPCVPLPEITLPAPAAVPPMVLALLWTKMPWPPLPGGA